MNILRILLFSFSLVYLLILQSIYFLYRIRFLKRFHPECKVISVGNITFGGTGKTPIVEFLAKYFQTKGKKVAVLIRGYGRDESLILQKRLADVVVLVGRARIKNSIKAVKDFGTEIIILDDGFQHWRLQRDLDIVAIDSSKPFGNGVVLPAGTLREPLSALMRADIFFLTRRDQIDGQAFKKMLDRLRKINSDALIVESIHRPLFFYRWDNPNEKLFFDEQRPKEAVLVSSIGNPDSFQKTIESLGILVKRHFRFPDHFWYRPKDLVKIFDFSIARNIPNIITTQKDAIKLDQPLAISHQPSVISLFILVIEIDILKNGQDFFDRLNRTCNC